MGKMDCGFKSTDWMIKKIALQKNVACHFNQERTFKDAVTAFNINALWQDLDGGPGEIQDGKTWDY